MTPPGEWWTDDEAGPVVRPYALTRGRTRPTGGSLDLVAMVQTARGVTQPAHLDPEQRLVLHRCQQPTSVAELAAGLRLPIGVVGVLLGDLREGGLIHIYH